MYQNVHHFVISLLTFFNSNLGSLISGPCDETDEIFRGLTVWMVSLQLVSLVAVGSFEVLVLVPTFGVMAVTAASN